MEKVRPPMDFQTLISYMFVMSHVSSCDIQEDIQNFVYFEKWLAGGNLGYFSKSKQTGINQTDTWRGHYRTIAEPNLFCIFFANKICLNQLDRYPYYHVQYQENPSSSFRDLMWNGRIDRRTDTEMDGQTDKRHSYIPTQTKSWVGINE